MTLGLSSLSDGELADLSIAGRQQAFAELLRRHREPVYRLIVGNIADPDEALDLVQETFVSAHRALRRYDPERPMRAWLSRIALNKCRDWLRRRKVRRFLGLAPAAEAPDLPEDRPTQEMQAADRQELERVAREIAELPSSLREPLVLHVLESLSQAETGAILSISEKAVETRLRRARIRLSERIGR